MDKLFVATTPSISYKFKVVPVENIVTAVLTCKKDDEILIRKTLSDATVGTDTLTFTFTQEDTILLGVGRTKVLLNWVTDGGTRGTSNEMLIDFRSNHIEEVL